MPTGHARVANQTDEFVTDPARRYCPGRRGRRCPWSSSSWSGCLSSSSWSSHPWSGCPWSGSRSAWGLSTVPPPQFQQRVQLWPMPRSVPSVQVVPMPQHWYSPQTQQRLPVAQPLPLLNFLLVRASPVKKQKRFSGQRRLDRFRLLKPRRERLKPLSCWFCIEDQRRTGDGKELCRNICESFQQVAHLDKRLRPNPQFHVCVLQ